MWKRDVIHKTRKYVICCIAVEKGRITATMNMCQKFRLSLNMCVYFPWTCHYIMSCSWSWSWSGIEPRTLTRDHQDQDLQKLNSSALETQDLGLEITGLVKVRRSWSCSVTPTNTIPTLSHSPALIFLFTAVRRLLHCS